MGNFLPNNVGMRSGPIKAFIRENLGRDSLPHPRKTAKIFGATGTCHGGECGPSTSAGTEVICGRDMECGGAIIEERGTVVVKAVDGTCGICNHRYGGAGGVPRENVGQPTTV